VSVDIGGTPRRVALCDRHLLALAQARSGGPDAERRQQRLAEMDAWQRTFREEPPFGVDVGMTLE
jgi:hypothetical protein